METSPMIGRLRGILVSKQPPWLLVEVGGVGYELEAPMSTIYDLPATGKEVTLLTHYAVKEDSVALYGFLQESERTLFRNLQKVSGIGAKISLAVLSGVSTQEFARLVHAGDVVALTKIPGIGKKTAERIVVELRDRVDGLGVSVPGFSTTPNAPLDPAAEATVALQQLGYKPAEVTRLVQKVASDGDSAETIIRKALRAALGS
jgi:holliday junction DNA helicase RuvA